LHVIRCLRLDLVPVLLLLLVPSGTILGFDKAEVLGENRRTARRLVEIADKEKLARDKPNAERWADVVDELQAVLASAGNELVAAEDGRCVPARWSCHARLAGLPKEVLARYRRRIERQAEKWLEQGRRERDAVVLRRVVEEAFCSRSAETALDLLGDLAFEKGQFEQAESWWGQLVPLEPSDKAPPQREGGPPLYPDPQVDAARTRAKQLLARWFGQGHARPTEWRRLLDDFRKRHPRAEGHLAGERGLYWKRLEAVAAQEREPVVPSFDTDDWPTFAGAASRNRILPAESLSLAALSALCRHGRHWSLALGPDDPADQPPTVIKPVGEAARSLAFHPVIAGRYVLVADSQYITAIDSETGKRQRWYDLATHTQNPPWSTLPAPADLRCTLTVAGDCVLGRVGVQDLRSDRSEKEAKEQSFLLCLGLRADTRGEHLRWWAIADTKPGAFFEGTAVAARANVWIAVTRFEGARALTAIYCYPLDARGIATPRWKQDVCAAREPPPGERRYRHHLLTLAGPNVVYCSHSGVIVALDASTGRRAWALRYQQERIQEEEKPPAPRDLCPPVYAEGKLFIAPADSDQLHCLDPLTGRRLWLRDRLEATQLLGVGQGRLIFTTTTPKPGLRAVDAEDGSDSGGWFLEAPGADGTGQTFGRGFLAGDLVYWPTYHPKGGRIYAVTQKTGEQPDDPTLLDNLPAGNLAFGNGTFVSAGRTRLDIYSPTADSR
jgi:outer membrane protein assembly factor BamB